MAITINAIPNNRVTVAQNAEYTVSAQASTNTATYRIQYHLFSISDAQDVTNKNAIDPIGGSVKIDFLDDAKKSLSNIFPVGQSVNGYEDTEAVKTFSPLWACLETDLETCETTETNPQSSPEFRVLNSNLDIMLNQNQVLSLRPVRITRCRNSEIWLPVWAATTNTVTLRRNGVAWGAVTLSPNPLGSLRYLNYNALNNANFNEISYEVNGQQYIVNLESCCGNVEVASFTDSGSWEFMDFNHSRSFSVDTTGVQAIRNKVKEFCRKNVNAKYNLTKCLDLDWNDVEWIKSWLNTRQTKIKLNGAWVDAIIEDGSFEIFEEENLVLMNISVSPAKQLKAL